VSIDEKDTRALPERWEYPTLDEVVRFGASVSNLPDLPDDYLVSFIPMQAVEEITGRIDSSDVRPLSAVRKGYTSFVNGDVIFAKITPSMENGKVAVARNLMNGIGFGSTEFHVLHPSQGLDSKYLCYFMVRPSFRANAKQHMSGSGGQLRVPTEYLRQTVLPLPPLNEQKRIVEKLEVLLSNLDDAVQSLTNALEKLKQYRRSVLKAAIEGELTQEWREANQTTLEPASELLTRILQKRRERWEAEQKAKDRKNAAYEEPTAPDVSSLPGLPKGWVWTNLGQLKSFSLYGPRFSSEDYSEKGVNVLRTTDINEFGRVNVDTTPKLDLNNEEFDKYKVRPMDLLITRTGSIGTLAVFNDEIRAIAGAYLIQYRLALPEVVWYVFQFLKSPDGQTQLTGGSAGSGRLNLNAPNLEKIPIPLPPLAEQFMVIESIEQRFDEAAQFEAALNAELNRSEGLRQSMLEEAFSGKLVPQDPNDEPATILLERIREEKIRASQEAKVKKPKSTKPKTSQGSELISLADTLRTAGKALTPEELFKAAGYTFETKEQFFQDVRKARADGLIEEKRLSPNARDSLLSVLA
jgi:type I restriction enzyme, S subunit